MNDRPSSDAGTIQLRITIAAEEAPALFSTLLSIKDRRRRVRRLRELAIQGLLIERMGGQLMLPAGASFQIEQPDSSTAVVKPRIAPDIVKSHLVWGQDSQNEHDADT